jgi:hypothetical protein
MRKAGGGEGNRSQINRKRKGKKGKGGGVAKKP